MSDQTAPSKVAAPPLETGAAFTVKLGTSKAIPVHVLLSRVWAQADVSMHVDVPLEGTPGARLLAAKCGVLGVESASQKLFRSNEYGSFNPRGGKAGLTSLFADHDVDSDGAATHVRIHVVARPSKAARILASVLAKMQDVPTVASLNSPLIFGLTRDIGVVRSAAKMFYSALNSDSMIAVVGGKRSSVNSSFAAKFEKRFQKVYSSPELGKSVPVTTACCEKESHLFAIKLSAEQPAAAVLAAHVLSREAPIWMHAGRLIVTGNSEAGFYLHKVFANSLSNITRLHMTMGWYQSQVLRDVIGKHSVGNALAVAGIECGLPIKSMVALAGAAKVNVEKTIEIVATLGATFKGVKIVKPVGPISRHMIDVDSDESDDSDDSDDSDAPVKRRDGKRRAYEDEDERG